MRSITQTVRICQPDIEEIDMGRQLGIHLEHLAHDRSVSALDRTVDPTIGADIGRKSERGISWQPPPSMM
jgi:hypothetical protein